MAIDLTLEYTTLAVGSHTNSTMNKPTNTVDGNFLLAGITIQGTDVTITPPSGWTSIVKVTSPYGSVWLEIFYKRASSEPSSWTWTHAASTTAGFVKRITGVVSSGNPEDCTRDTVCINYLTLLTNSSISPVTAGCGICQILGDLYDSSWSSETLTERIDIADIAFCADVQAGSGPTGNKSATSSGSELSIGILIALKPEGGAPILEQEGFRFRNDDGDEVGATWAANQDSNLTQNAGTMRVRIIINATGDPAADTYQVEWQKVSEGVWRKVEN